GAGGSPWVWRVGVESAYAAARAASSVSMRASRSAAESVPSPSSNGRSRASPTRRRISIGAARRQTTGPAANRRRRFSASSRAPPPLPTTAPARGDARGEGAGLGDRLAFALPERSLALAREDGRHRPPRARFDERVGVDERTPEEACEPAPDLRLPGSHEAGEDDVGGGHLRSGGSRWCSLRGRAAHSSRALALARPADPSPRGVRNTSSSSRRLLTRVRLKSQPRTGARARNGTPASRSSPVVR